MSTLNKNNLLSGICADRSFPIDDLLREEDAKPITHTIPALPRKEKSTKSKRKDETTNQASKKKTSLYLPPDKFKVLKVLCAEMEITMTTFIEDAVDAKMKSELRKRGKESESRESSES